jgi:hypothetical protein
MASTERLYLVHLRTGDTVGAQFNPTEVQEALEVVWTNIEIPGESHEPMEYDRTKNQMLDFELGFDAESGQSVSIINTSQGQSSQFIGNVSDVNLVRRWLFACCYPNERAQGQKDMAPSRILVVWPGFYSLAMRLRRVQITNRQWESTSGPPVKFTAKLTFEADSDRRLYYEDILAFGTERSDSAGELTTPQRTE